MSTSTRSATSNVGDVSARDFRGLAGLTEAEAQRRLASEGTNDLPAQKKRGIWRVVLEVIREPMLIMLVAAGVLYVLMGEPGDAAVLLGSVLIVMAITVIQERRTERALDALRDLSSPRARVIRDGAPRRIPGREMARGDLVVLAEGDRVPADALLRRGINLAADESALTGESVPVRKTASVAASKLEPPGGDDLPSVFSGTVVTAGQGIAEVLATGTRSELGKIGKSLAGVEACTLVFESEQPESDVMQRPPRGPGDRLFSFRTTGVSILQGVSILAACLGVFFLARRDHGEGTVRAHTFATLVIASVVLITVNRSWSRSLIAMLRVPNTAFRWVVGGTLALLVLVLFVPWPQRLFHFAAVYPNDLAFSVAAASFCLLWFEALKRVRQRRARAPRA